jgi:hypothetical protein
MRRALLVVTALVLASCIDFKDALGAFCDGGHCVSDGGAEGGSGGGAIGGAPGGSGGSGGSGGGGGGAAGGSGGAGGGDACSNGVRDGTESDVDCGGTCPAKCAVDGGCGAPTDCASGFCNLGLSQCVASQCQDGVQNGGELGLDCGGPCLACATGCGACSAYATCTGMDAGAPQCVCNPGYVGDGGTCECGLA